MKIEELMIENFYVRALKKGNELVRNQQLSSRSYANYISVCQKVLNHAYDNRNIFEPYKIKDKYRTTDVYWLSREKKLIEPYNVYEAIQQVKSLQQWQSVALWLLSFSLRGFYYSDIVALTDEKLQNKKGEPTPRNLFSEMYIDTMRAKSNINI